MQNILWEALQGAEKLLTKQLPFRKTSPFLWIIIHSDSRKKVEMNQ